MKRPQKKQYPAAKTGWEERTGQKTVGVRLGEAERARLSRLAARYGGKREAIEVALKTLEEVLAQQETTALPGFSAKGPFLQGGDG